VWVFLSKTQGYLMRRNPFFQMLLILFAIRCYSTATKLADESQKTFLEKSEKTGGQGKEAVSDNGKIAGRSSSFEEGSRASRLYSQAGA
ncbi:MAG: hypothetical protein D3909_05590, partial [Candidatus Electrothrix sp. ATG1]|nr:hypothetical protein [Candidatus Electrothrix sp. ATG1]